MSEVTRRPGGRSARVREAVIEAALDELAERGPDAASIESVAQRAGVNKTTIYRRWESPIGLIVDAIASAPVDNLPPPDTGSFLGDLVALRAATEPTFNNRRSFAITRALLASSQPEVAAAQIALWTARRDVMRGIVERAIDRGEARGDVDSDAIFDLLYGAAMMRPLVFREVVPPDAVAGYLDIVMLGLQPRR